METVKLAEQKKLSIVNGLCWRYDSGVRETMKRVLDGEIGEIITIQENYLTGGLWNEDRKPQWSEMEYQIRNWLYFTWLSGDHNVEQHVHSLDKAAWAMREEPPLRATGLGGRQVRTDAKYGHIFDHHAVCYEYANGARLYSFCRQQDGTAPDTEDYFLGTEGRCHVLKNTIYNRKGEVVWRYRGPRSNMYQQEHNELFASIRAGKPVNNGLYMARSSMLAILGRMVTYTGKTITWEEAINSKEDLRPAKYEWGPIETPKVAMPGITEFV
jgi:predicted dehydrogenase